MSTTDAPDAGADRRKRLSRVARLEQLLSTAWQIIAEAGTDALTLGQLAERAGVSKPVVYDHFPTRPALLTALYRQFDQRQTAIIDAALAASPPDLPARASIIATCYVDCVLEQGREIPGIVAALAGSPELAQLKREYDGIFLEKCRAMLAPLAPSGQLSQAVLWAVLGAAEGLSRAAADGDIKRQDAIAELAALIQSRVAASV